MTVRGSVDDVVIELTEVTKLYRRAPRLRDLLTDAVMPWRRREETDVFQVLKSINLSVRRGEVIGIIGPNGAGKTTLVKVISGLLSSDGGSLEVKGTVNALLALGLGVHPDFTGRENIYFGGLVAGMTKEEIAARTDDIISFAELGEFIDQPFRTYSSGMRARLVFSIAMSVEPDILIIDEALATGDAYFVEKCQRRIREHCSSGATVLMVSHNLQQIEEACERVILMEKGRIVFDGGPREAIDRYIDLLHVGLVAAEGSAPLHMTQGTGQIQVLDAFARVLGQRSPVVNILEDCELHLIFDVLEDLGEISVCIDLFSEKSATSFAFLTSADVLKGRAEPSVFPVTPGRYEAVFTLPSIPLGDGDYWCDIVMFSGNPDYNFSYVTSYCYYRRAFKFRAVYANKRYFGRGTLCEVPVSSITVHRVSSDVQLP